MLRIVKRTHHTKALNNGGKLFQNVVDIRIGCISADRESERAVCLLNRNTDCKQNMRRFKGA